MKSPSYLLLAMIYLAFIALGLPDSMLGVAWPTMRSNLSLPLEALGLLTLLLTLLSALSSFASGPLTRKMGTGPLVVVSTLATAGALWVISGSSNFTWLLAAAIPLGLGAGGVDSSLNSYVARHYSGRHMNWLHSFWGVGATVGPLVMTAALVNTTWRGGYQWIALAQLVLALVLLATLPLWKRNRHRSESLGDPKDPEGRIPLKSWATWLSTGIYALYVTAEFSVGLWSNSLLVESRGLVPALSGVWIATYYGSIMGGRMLVGLVVNRWGNRNLISLGLGVSLLGALLLIFPGSIYFNLAGLILLGLGFAPIYPCLMHETPRRFTSEASPVVMGRQVGAAYLGAAIFPGLLGWFMARTSLEILGPVVLVLIGILSFAIYKLNKMD